MSWWEVLWGVFLTGLPFAHFILFPSQLNQWQAQTLWAQGGLAVLFGLALGQPSTLTIRNRPLGGWVIWIGLSVVGIWIDYLRHDQQHPIGILPPFMHCLCLVAFYVAATTQWTTHLLSRLLTWLAYAGLLLVVYGWVQVLNFDQFHKFIDGSKHTDTLFGTIGNPTHFGTHLALLLPIFLWQLQWWWKAVAGLAGVLIVLTSSTSAVVCGFAVLLWWSWREARWLCYSLCIMGCGVGWWLATSPSWTNPYGRIEAWTAFWQHYLVGDGKHQITGSGLGRVMDDALRHLGGLPDKWHHVHNEYFQVLIEQGLIGLGLVLWALGDAIRRWWGLPKTATSKTLAGMGIVFLLSSLVNFPAHLWILASLGLVAYCGVYVLAAEHTKVT